MVGVPQLSQLTAINRRLDANRIAHGLMQAFAVIPHWRQEIGEA
jgi:hypothetical protein